MNQNSRPSCYTRLSSACWKFVKVAPLINNCRPGTSIQAKCCFRLKAYVADSQFEGCPLLGLLLPIPILQWACSSATESQVVDLTSCHRSSELKLKPIFNDGKNEPWSIDPCKEETVRSLCSVDLCHLADLGPQQTLWTIVSRKDGSFVMSSGLSPSNSPSAGKDPAYLDLAVFSEDAKDPRKDPENTIKELEERLRKGDDKLKVLTRSHSRLEKELEQEKRFRIMLQQQQQDLLMRFGPMITMERQLSQGLDGQSHAAGHPRLGVSPPTSRSGYVVVPPYYHDPELGTQPGGVVARYAPPPKQPASMTVMSFITRKMGALLPSVIRWRGTQVEERVRGELLAGSSRESAGSERMSMAAPMIGRSISGPAGHFSEREEDFPMERTISSPGYYETQRQVTWPGVRMEGPSPYSTSTFRPNDHRHTLPPA